MWLDALETYILDGLEEFSAMLASLSVGVIALEIAISTTSSDMRFSRGIALDYLHMIARALRSRAAAEMFSKGTANFASSAILNDIFETLAAAAAIGGLDEALAQIHADTAIPAHLRERFPQPT